MWISFDVVGVVGCTSPPDIWTQNYWYEFDSRCQRVIRLLMDSATSRWHLYIYTNSNQTQASRCAEWWAANSIMMNMRVNRCVLIDTPRAGLDYNEEVHWLVKNFQPMTRLFETMVGMVEKMGKIIKEKCLKLEFSGGQVSYLKVWGCSRNLT